MLHGGLVNMAQDWKKNLKTLKEMWKNNKQTQN